MVILSARFVRSISAISSGAHSIEHKLSALARSFVALILWFVSWRRRGAIKRINFAVLPGVARRGRDRVGRPLPAMFSLAARG